MAMAMADMMVVMQDGHIRQAGSPRDVFERPVSPFIARFIGCHNVLSGPDGSIAVRADRCRLGIAGDGPFVTGRVTAVEYQGAMVRVAMATDPGSEASALVPDREFYAQPVAPGDPARVIWAEHEAHVLLEACAAARAFSDRVGIGFAHTPEDSNAYIRALIKLSKDVFGEA